MAEIMKELDRLDRRERTTSDPAELREINAEREYLREEYRRIMGV